MLVSCNYKDTAALFLDFHIFFSLLLLRMLYQPKMLVFDVLRTRLNNQLSLWYVYEQLYHWIGVK